MGLVNSEKAVSPLIATFVLIIVVITGAAAIGSHIGSLSKDVSQQTATERVTIVANADLSIAGSYQINPISEIVAQDFMEKYSGMSLSVQGSSSQVGISAVDLGVVDVGATTESFYSKDKYPKMQMHEIGLSAVCLVVASDSGMGGSLSAEEAKSIYEAARLKGSYSVTESDVRNVDYSLTFYDFNFPTGNIMIYSHADESIAEQTLSRYLDGRDYYIDLINTTRVTGDQEMVDAVSGNKNAFGFVEWWFYEQNRDSLKLIGIDYPAGQDIGTIKADIVEAHQTLEYRKENCRWPKDLTEEIVYVTDGEPSQMEKEFINLASSSEYTQEFHQNGFFSVTEI